MKKQRDQANLGKKLNKKEKKKETKAIATSTKHQEVPGLLTFISYYLPERHKSATGK